MPLRRGEILIDDDWRDPDALFRPRVNGEPKARGGIPRDYEVQPETMFAPPSEIILIPESEWSDRIKEKEATKSNLSDLRLTGNAGAIVPSLDQGQVGYCWAHSTTHSVMLDRMVRGQKYVPLSAYSVAATIKRGADQGGWCGLSAEYMTSVGVASQAVWPQGDRQYTKYVNDPAYKASANAHRIVEDWVDLTKAVYYRNLAFKMLASLLLVNISGPVDFNWWGHSVCALDLVEVEPASFGIRIWNSWGDGWGDRGMGVLRGSKAIPDGAMAVRASTASAA